MRIKNWESYNNIKLLKQNKKYSGKSDLSLSKRRKRSEGHLLLERKSDKI